MFKFWWPIGLIILSSVGYQVGLKEVSTGMDPFVALVVTYLVASAVSFAIYFIQGTGGSRMEEGHLHHQSGGPRSWRCHRRHRAWERLHVPGRLDRQYRLHRVERPYRPRPHGHGDPPLRRKDHPEEDPGRRHFHGRHRRHHIGLTSISVCCIMK